MQAETIIGDRTGDLTALSTRRWDAVVDVAAYDPEVVVRDLGSFITDGARQGLRGLFNVTGEPIPFGRLLDECVAGTGSRDADLRWVPSDRLLAGPS